MTDTAANRRNAIVRHSVIVECVTNELGKSGRVRTTAATRRLTGGFRFRPAA